MNGSPHIGFAMEVIQADVVARYHRLKGDDTFYLTGTDEYGSKMRDTAKTLGLTEKELADQNSAKFVKLAEDLHLSNDDFIRTTEDRHTETVQKLWKLLNEAGDIYKKKYSGLYCVGCEVFVLDKDLVDGKCPEHLKEPQFLEEENYFFKLSRYSEQIKKLIETDELRVVPASRKNEILALCETGLEDISFSRPKTSLKWGIEVPEDPDHVMYVWCDALTNYLTGLNYHEEGELYKKYWSPDVQVIGKGILRFHAAYWIGMLLSAGLPIPKSIYVHGYITSEGQKMSKSLGNVVDPFEYIEKYGSEALRYFLIREVPTTGDGDFSVARFKTVYSSELANNLGNLLSRVVAMSSKYCDGEVPEKADAPKELTALLDEVLEKYHASFENFDLKAAVEEVGRLLDFANKYVEDQKPWQLVKTDEAEVKAVLYRLLEVLRYSAILLAPVIPLTSEKIIQTLGLSPDNLKFDQLEWAKPEKGTRLEKPEQLFPRLED